MTLGYCGQILGVDLTREVVKDERIEESVFKKLTLLYDLIIVKKLWR